MKLLHLTSCAIAVTLPLVGCRAEVTGHYKLDVAETTKCVEQAAATDAEGAQAKDSTLKLLPGIDLDVDIDPAGKMLSTTIVNGNAGSTTKIAGTWALKDKRVVIQVPDETDTTCDVDGVRLRCEKPSPVYELLGRYVLVKK